MAKKWITATDAETGDFVQLCGQCAEKAKVCDLNFENLKIATRVLDMRFEIINLKSCNGQDFEVTRIERSGQLEIGVPCFGCIKEGVEKKYRGRY